jgi:microcystin-dependent protein
MCNGQNNTPDLRGRVPVGATNTLSTNPFPAQTNPGVNGNPVYTYGLTPGANTVRLELSQIPAHTHGTTVTINDPGHSHSYLGVNGPSGEGRGDRNSVQVTKETGLKVTGLKGTGTGQNVFVNILDSGQNGFHPNVQPGLALYYIQYRPV